MSKNDNYYAYFIGFIFLNHPSGLKTTQLYHILHGKRTGSTLFQAFQLDLLRYFNLFPMMSRRDFEKIIDKYHSSQWLTEVDKQIYVLTELGVRKITTYFEEHYLPEAVDQGKYSESSRLFWWRIQLLTQVLSEKYHENTNYTPAVKKYHVQFWVKMWVAHQSDSTQFIIAKFKNEWLTVGDKLSSEQAEAIIRQLTGYERIGDTTYELQTLFQMSKEEWHLFFLDSWHTFISQLDEETPLFLEMYRHTSIDALENLSRSAWETKKMLQEGLTIQQVAQAKRVKPSTVGDHVIEMAIMQETFDFSTFVSRETREKILHFLRTNEDHSFKAFYKEQPDIPFLDYRLTQIERYKDND